MKDRERIFGYTIETLIGRLFTDARFLEMAKRDPEGVALAFSLGPGEARGFADIVSRFDKSRAVELAKATVAGGYGCSSGGDS